MSPETTSKKIAELQSLRSQVTRWRVGVPIAVIAIITGNILMVYSAADSLARGPEREVFVQGVTSGMEDDVMPIVKHIAYRGFHDTKKSVENEFQKISDRTPEFADALRGEIEKLVENVPDRTQQDLSEILADTLAKQDQKIEELFPDASEDKVADIVEKLAAMGKDQAEYVSDRLFEPHLVTINNIIDDLDVIRKSESIHPGDTLASWEMALLVFDVLRVEFDQVHPAPEEIMEDRAKRAEPASPKDTVAEKAEPQPTGEKKEDAKK